jgi:hypothetical protein
VEKWRHLATSRGEAISLAGSAKFQLSDESGRALHGAPGNFL